MLLAVDIGNSSAKCGLFVDERLREVFRIPHRAGETPDSITSLLRSGLTGQLSASIVSSVVPEKTAGYLGALLEITGKEPLIADHTSDLGMTIDYDPPEGAGSDRLLAAAAAVELVGAPCIVCDLGTAATIDLVSSDRTYRGGVIAAGLKMLSRGLREGTALLPLVEPEKKRSVIGKTTRDSVASGLYFGYAAFVDGIIDRMLEESAEDCRIIATGGDSALIASATRHIREIEPDLVLKGLRIAFERNS